MPDPRSHVSETTVSLEQTPGVETAGLDRHDALAAQCLDRQVVVDVPVLDHATMAVIRVFAQTNIRDDYHLWHRMLDGADGLLNNAVVGKVLQSNWVFVGREAKEQDRFDTKLGALFCLCHGFIDGKLRHTRH